MKELLKKYGSKISFKKSENLIREEHFKSIEITVEYDARTLRNIQRQCTTRKKDESGEWFESFDKDQYNTVMVMNLVKFDGKALTREEIDRMESGFLIDLVKLLTAQGADDSEKIS